MRFLAIAAVPCAPPKRIGRELARCSTTRLRDARAWASRNAATFIGALDPGEPGFSVFVTDADNDPALTLAYGRDPDAEPVELDRDDLQELLTTTKGETT